MRILQVIRVHCFSPHFSLGGREDTNVKNSAPSNVLYYLTRINLLFVMKFFFFNEMTCFSCCQKASPCRKIHTRIRASDNLEPPKAGLKCFNQGRKSSVENCNLKWRKEWVFCYHFCSKILYIKSTWSGIMSFFNYYFIFPA